MDANASMVNILIAISNRILCESLCEVLENKQSKYVCFSHFHGNPPLPHLVLFDPATPLEPLQAKYAGAKFMLMDTGLKDQEISYLLFYHKVSGVIPPTTSMDLFLKALRVVLNGQIWIDNKHLHALLQNNGSINRNGGIRTLSPQDKRISELVAQGLKNREIAKQLCLSEHTIKAHLSRIFKILDINSRTQLVSLILEDGQSKRQDVISPSALFPPSQKKR